uniref:Reverse transcriptase domain-containing protein n=1 Tax=Mola mola TaxID=94237 RepID=A0A3Q3W265_MOLML
RCFRSTKKLKQGNRSEQRSDLNPDVTMSEIQVICENFFSRNKKNSLSDGYTDEFYREFQNDIFPLLYEVFNWTLENETWRATWNSAIITVLLKSGKKIQLFLLPPHKFIKYISIQYKLLPAVLACRLAKILP